MAHYFSFLPAESAGWIPLKQAHNDQVLSYRSMSREDSNCCFQKMLTELKQMKSEAYKEKVNTRDEF
jgi:hypothetical protein